MKDQKFKPALIIKTIEKTRMFNENEKIEYLFLFNDAKKEFRNEKRESCKFRCLKGTRNGS